MTDTTPQGEAVLLPCPFCGSTNISIQDDGETSIPTIGCDDCLAGCTGATNGTDCELIAKWNTRAALAPPNAAIPSAEPVALMFTVPPAVLDALRLYVRECVAHSLGEPNDAASAEVEFAMTAKAWLLAAPPNVQSGDSGVREALVELIACKDLKDRAEAIIDAEPCNIAHNTRYAEWVALSNDYRKRQPLAWAAARAAIEREEREKKA